jgi:DNA-binding XRE family transcriptional regulator
MDKEKQYRILNFIKDYRKKFNITQEDLAAELKVTQGFITKIEKGDKKPSLTLAFLILKAIQSIYADRTGLNPELTFEQLFQIEKIT